MNTTSNKTVVNSALNFKTSNLALSNTKQLKVLADSILTLLNEKLAKDKLPNDILIGFLVIILIILVSIYGFLYLRKNSQKN